MENHLNDLHEVEKNYLKNDEFLSFAVNHERRVDSISKKLVASNSISEETRRSQKPVRTKPGIIKDFMCNAWTL